MRPVRVPIPATGTPGPVVPLDIYQKGPVSIAVSGVQGAVNIDVEYTLDDVFAANFSQSTAQWFPVAALQNLNAAATSQLVDANNAPIMATALRTTNSGAGTAILQVVQSGVMG